MVLYLLGRKSMIDVFVCRFRTIPVRCSEVAISSQASQAAKDWLH
jgi:hypothetical protein